MALFTRQINTLLALPGWTATPGTVAAPTNLRTTATTSSTATLAWDAVAGTYTLERATVTNGVAGTFSPVYTNTAKTYQDGPLSFGATYAYRVLVTAGGVASGYSNVLQASPATANQLAAPANLRQSASTSSSNTLAWDAAPNATGYELQRAGQTIYAGSSRTYLDSGLPASTSYGYTVRALDNTGTYSTARTQPH